MMRLSKLMLKKTTTTLHKTFPNFLLKDFTLLQVISKDLWKRGTIARGCRWSDTEQQQHRARETCVPQKQFLMEIHHTIFLFYWIKGAVCAEGSEECDDCRSRETGLNLTAISQSLCLK
jgi:hypothetical protein